MEKTRLAQAVDDEIVDSHKTVIKALTAVCAEVEHELARRIAADRALARKREILLSIPGIGARIAPLLITDMPELGTLDRKAVASLAGLAPHPEQSGARPGRNAIAGGRPCIRSAFYMAGMVAARTQPVFKTAYKAMRDAGKPPKVAIIAVGRRVALLANALLREEQAVCGQQAYQTCRTHRRGLMLLLHAVGGGGQGTALSPPSTATTIVLDRQYSRHRPNARADPQAVSLIAHRLRQWIPGLRPG